MSKLRIVYTLSLVIVGVLLVFVFFSPITGGEQDYSVVQREHLLEKEDQWIIELHLLNYEGKETEYTINVLVNDELCTESIRLRHTELFKYVHHIYKDRLDKGEVSLAIYKEGEGTPFKMATYYLK